MAARRFTAGHYHFQLLRPRCMSCDAAMLVNIRGVGCRTSDHRCALCQTAASDNGFGMGHNEVAPAANGTGRFGLLHYARMLCAGVSEPASVSRGSRGGWANLAAHRAGNIGGQVPPLQVVVYMQAVDTQAAGSHLLCRGCCTDTHSRDPGRQRTRAASSSSSAAANAFASDSCAGATSPPAI
jgi:hypothetical protein